MTAQDRDRQPGDVIVVTIETDGAAAPPAGVAVAPAALPQAVVALAGLRSPTLAVLPDASQLPPHASYLAGLFLHAPFRIATEQSRYALDLRRRADRDRERHGAVPTDLRRLGPTGWSFLWSRTTASTPRRGGGIVATLAARAAAGASRYDAAPLRMLGLATHPMAAAQLPELIDLLAAGAGARRDAAAARQADVQRTPASAADRVALDDLLRTCAQLAALMAASPTRAQWSAFLAPAFAALRDGPPRLHDAAQLPGLLHGLRDHTLAACLAAERVYLATASVADALAAAAAADADAADADAPSSPQGRPTAWPRRTNDAAVHAYQPLSGAHRSYPAHAFVPLVPTVVDVARVVTGEGLGAGALAPTREDVLAWFDHEWGVPVAERGRQRAALTIESAAAAHVAEAADEAAEAARSSAMDEALIRPYVGAVLDAFTVAQDGYLTWRPDAPAT